MHEISPKKPLPAGARRRRVAVGADERVQGALLSRDAALPWCVRPAADGIDLTAWASAPEGAATLHAWLMEHRAVLFRGFAVRSVADFERFVLATSDGKLLEYKDRTTPRTSEGNRIYTATVHPADQRINPHNEGTYWVRWPAKLYFCCLKAPSRGGETPLTDVRRVYQRLDPEVRARFEDKQFMLVRNYNDGFGLPWQEVFQTEDSAEVERFCAANSIELEWKPGGRLRTRQVRPAVRVHPRTGEKVWFNHAAFYHHTTLEPGMRAALVAEFGEDGLPYNTYYGDGSPIDPADAAHVRAAYAAEQTMFPWREGDVLLLDNMSVAHAREPYEGERLVLVSMTDAIEGGCGGAGAGAPGASSAGNAAAEDAE
jgi:alpha-ketoglutarate-dependent taurine dioxygenase